MSIYGKNPLKIFFPGTTGLILKKLCMNHQRLKQIIYCSNNDPGLTYFTKDQILQYRLFHGENVTMMDSLEIIASCDLEFG